MRGDEPTLPNRGWYDAGVDRAPDEPHERETPTWPARAERPSWGTSRPGRWPKGYASALALGMSLGVNVLLILGVLALLLLGHISLGTTSGSSTPGAALSSPTVAATLTPLSGWLRIAPSNVQLGCADGQRTQFVVLQNTGPQNVQWQVVGTSPADQVGVSVSPNQGDLKAGASLPVQVQNTTHASGSQGIASQHGVIRFAATAADAGPAPSLTYLTVGCP